MVFQEEEFEDEEDFDMVNVNFSFFDPNIK